MNQRQRPGLLIVSFLMGILGQAQASGGVVSAEKECYEYDEPIVISFEIEEPGTDDWVGIYPDDMVNGDVEPSMWVSSSKASIVMANE